MQNQDFKFFAQGGLDTDSAPEYVANNDWINSINVRVVGTSEGESGYITNPESTIQIDLDILAGINKGIGGKAFEIIRKIVFFRYNSFGNNQICIYNDETKLAYPIYTDKVNSNDIPLLPLDPQFYINCILINDKYLVWTDGKTPVGFTNLEKLENGDYATVIEEDLSLIKPQPLPPITGMYGNDPGKASNFLKGKLFQFTSQYVGDESNRSTWGTWSKRIIPLEESSPSVGSDTSKNNCIILSVDAGSIRTKTLNVATRYGNNIFNIVKSIDRDKILLLPNVAIDVSAGIYESYNPGTNKYNFVFYNEDLNIPVAPTETDLFVDYVPGAANAVEVINGNIIGLGGLSVGEARPVTDVTIGVIGYDPNISVPLNTDPNPFRFVSSSYKGFGGPPYTKSFFVFAGSPKTGDVVGIGLVNQFNSSDTLQYSYTVQPSQDGNLDAVISAFASSLPKASFVGNGDGSYTITVINDADYGTPAYFYIPQSGYVRLFNAGSGTNKSIHALLDNSSYQLALSYRDKYGRPFPLLTGNEFIVTTPSYAQLNGLTPSIQWTINNLLAPVGAYDYQWLITKNNTTDNILDILGSLINYKGTWNAATNIPALAPNIGVIGDTYQITTPSIPTNDINLGNGVQSFKTGDYVVYNGQSWDVVAKNFGDLTTSSTSLVFKLNPLKAFNDRYTNAGANTVLSYDFSENDRCTLHYYLDGPLTVYIKSPTVDLSVFGYNPTTNLLKVEKSATFDESVLVGNNVFMRLYSPKQQTQEASADQDTTLWYEIGERFTIANGNHDTLSGTITDGDVYFKTRQYQGAVNPNDAFEVLATDFNFSDFYPSKFTSYGRPRSYYDVLEKTVRKASIITSENYIDGSRNNGLNRFYPSNIYGDGDGETSSSHGAIQVLWERSNTLVVVQEYNVGYIPVNATIYEDMASQQQIAKSEKLLNNIRYNTTGNFGCGKAKESFCFRNSIAYFIDPFKSQPMQLTLQGVTPIPGKMSKYFKSVIQLAYSQGKKLVQYYNNFYEEVQLCIEAEGGVLYAFPFNVGAWEYIEQYQIAPADITAVSTPAGTTRTFNSGTGVAVYTPDPSFVGNKVGTFTFNVGTGSFTKNVCLNWTPGDSEPNSFAFIDRTGVELSTDIESNAISVNGINIPVAISIVGGSYKINSGPYTTAPGTVVDGDIVTVKVMSSALNSTTTTTTLTIGSQSAPFNVTTKGVTSGNFRVFGGYGMTVKRVVDFTTTGVPASLLNINIAPGSVITAPYTTITAGQIKVTLNGSPTVPHVRLLLIHNGTIASSTNVVGTGVYVLSVTAPINDPDIIEIDFDFI